MVVITKKKEREVVNEDMASNVKAILEFVSVIPAIQEDIRDLKKGHETLVDSVEALKVGHKMMHEDVKLIKSDLKEVKQDLKQKIDREEFEKHDHRAVRSA